MGCKDCEDFQENRGGSYPYRWGNATVELLACEKHALEIFAALNLAQQAKIDEAEERAYEALKKRVEEDTTI